MRHIKSRLSAAIAFTALTSSAFAAPTTLGTLASADSDSIAIGMMASGTNFGYAIGGMAYADNEALAFGERAYSSTKSVAIGSNSYASNSALALGDSSNAVGLGSVAIGAGSTAFDDYSVSFGSSSQTRRLMNIADGSAPTDAATFGQLQASAAAMTTVTNGMSATLASYGTRIGSLETAFANLSIPTPPAPTPPVPTPPTTAPGADTGYVDAGDASTLAAANANAAAGDAQTLSTANSNAVIGDKKTLQNANWYSDAGDARTLASANAYSDAGDARLSRKIDDLDSQLSAGIAAVAAQPPLPAMAPGQKAIAFGTGHYNGKNAIGLVAGYNPGRNLTYGFGISAATEDSTPVFRTFVTKVW